MIPFPIMPARFFGLSLPPGILLPLFSAVLCAWSPAATGDWLVTTEGELIETDGAWQEKGRIVVFRTAEGELLSLRSSGLDLDASRQATEAAVEEAAALERAIAEAERSLAEPKRPAVLTLTDDDVGHVDEDTPEGGEDFEDEELGDGEEPEEEGSADGADGDAAAEGTSGRRVVMYSTEWCGVCKQAKAFFAQNGVPYVDRDIEKDAAARRDFEAKGGTGVPLIDVGGEVVKGFSPDRIRKLLGR